jgi:hypothetical protein
MKQNKKERDGFRMDQRIIAQYNSRAEGLSGERERINGRKK